MLQGMQTTRSSSGCEATNFLQRSGLLELSMIVDALVRARDIFSGTLGRPPLIPISKTKFFELVRSGEFPPADVRLGKAVLWKTSTVQRFIDAVCTEGQGAAS